MATIAYQVVSLQTLNGHTHQVVWGPMQNTDVGAPFIDAGAADRSVQASGTFGAGGSVSMEGSNEPQVGSPMAALAAVPGAPNYISLHDPQGNALAITAAKIENIAEVANATRPHVTAGDGTTSLWVSMVVRRPL